MPDLPIVGAQLTVLDLPTHIDWLIEKNRDLELAEFSINDILRSPDQVISIIQQRLDGWNGRLGLHGPFSGFELDVKDKEIRSIVQCLIDKTLDAAEKLGAKQIVLHSPYDAWDQNNLDNTPIDRKRRVSAIIDTLTPAVKRAENMGCTIVLENIKDTDPAHRQSLVDAADSDALKLSVDVGHAHWAHSSCGAPPADRFISAAGNDLCHVHLQDADGFADRHWALGEGNILFAPIFAALANISSKPHMIVEINEFSKIAESVRYLERLGLAQ